MPALVAVLGNHLRRQVVDRTGITAEFDFNLEYARPDDECASCPSPSTALQDKLGLRLEPTKAPAEVLVVDRVEKPSEN